MATLEFSKWVGKSRGLGHVREEFLLTIKKCFLRKLKSPNRLLKVEKTPIRKNLWNRWKPLVPRAPSDQGSLHFLQKLIFRWGTFQGSGPSKNGTWETPFYPGKFPRIPRIPRIPPVPRILPKVHTWDKHPFSSSAHFPLL